MEKLTIEDLARFCKKTGFVYQNSDIYGGHSGFFEYGPRGVELFNNIKAQWWKYFVRSREDMVGIDGALISHPQVWKSSGHLDGFNDLNIICSKCNSNFRADHLIDDTLKIATDGIKAKEVNEIVKKNNLKCPLCGGAFAQAHDFNLMFPVPIGASKEKIITAYLRGELAQNIFINFRNVIDTMRVALPFGIASVGNVFRNEISPRDFLFRCREFTIAEFEYFIHPKETKCSLLTVVEKKYSFTFLSAKEQDGKRVEKQVTIGDLVTKKLCDEWHAYWLAHQFFWFESVGIQKENLRLREHKKTELSHYSSATFDIEYKFSFGTKEVAGNANRGQFDLTNHEKASNVKMRIYDEDTKEHILPRVIEPTWGMGRVFLMTIADAYRADDKRMWLALAPSLAPVQLAVFPLLSNKPELVKKAREVHTQLVEFNPVFDDGGSIGKRYARNDEIGTPVCVTIDFETLENDSVTLRDRDTAEQRRVKIEELQNVLGKILRNGMTLKDVLA